VPESAVEAGEGFVGGEAIGDGATVGDGPAGVKDTEAASSKPIISGKE